MKEHGVSKRDTHNAQTQALAYVLLWQYALCIPMLILNVTLYLAIIKQAYPI